VAILDFDVHHGNGTRACVSNTAPGKLQVPFSTPMSEGVHIYNTYQPWFDTDDDDNILFASVQGYGPKSSTRPGRWSVISPRRPASVSSAGHFVPVLHRESVSMCVSLGISCCAGWLAGWLAG